MPFISSVRGSFSPSGRSKRLGAKDVISGGAITIAGGYRIHAFTNTGSNTFSTLDFGFSLPVEILMVGGGGGSGTYAGGGGGGEVLYISRTITSGSYSLNVGAGGIGDASNYNTAKNGNPTTGFGETAKPGGGARSSDDRDTPISGTGTYSTVANGGGGSSRSGGYFGSLGTSAGSGVTRYGGNRGGQDDNTGSSPNQSPNYPGGGGGGAGASVTGNTGGGGNGSAGGIGIANSIMGTSYFWAGGGGGGTYYGGSGGNGGSGGGGGGSGGSGGGSGGSGINTGGNGSTGAGGYGGANTGGGGGAGRGETGSRGGDGGSGIIVVRYAI